jgi:hypothetical protein
MAEQEWEKGTVERRSADRAEVGKPTTERPPKVEDSKQVDVTKGMHEGTPDEQPKR